MSEGAGGHWAERFAPGRRSWRHVLPLGLVMMLFGGGLVGEWVAPTAYESLAVFPAGIILLGGALCIYQTRVIAALANAAEEAGDRSALLIAVTENVVEGMIAADASGQFLVFNPAAERLIGRGALAVPPSEWGRVYRVYDSNGERLLDEHELPLVRAMRGDVVNSIELCLKRAGRGPTYLSCSGSPLRDASGTLIGGVITLQDITERRLAQDRIAQNEQRLHRALIHAPIPVMLFAEDGEILLTSDRWSELSGYSREDLVTVSDWLRRALGPDATAMQQVIDQLVELGGHVQEGEFTVRCKDGVQRIWDFSSASLGALPDGRRLIVSMAADVTDQRLAAAALAQSEDRLRRAIHGTDEGIWDWEVESDRVWYAPRLARLLGYEDGEIPNSFAAFQTHVHPEDRPRTAEALRRHLDYDEPFDLLYRLRTKSGVYRWFRARASTVREDGLPLRMAGAIQDVHELTLAQEELGKKTEALLQLNQELARSNEDLKQFAYAASHDLQEPLRAVIGYCQLLEGTLCDTLDAESLCFLRNAAEGAKRMQRLIQDLLAYARVARQGSTLEIIDGNSVVEEAIINLQSAIEESGAIVHLAGLPVVRGDRRQLSQLFQNLIGNAIKYRSQASPEIEITSQQCGTEWTISVRDNGIGIDPAYGARIFTLFQRLHTRDEYEGTGIGLAVCKKIVERHGGRIWVESEPGKGSTFLFTLLAVKNPEAASLTRTFEWPE